MPLDRQPSGAAYAAEAVEQRDGEGWFVAWYERNGPAFGARGANLPEPAARNLADRIRSGEERP